ncbi:hypothetical protein BU24DRAFT_416819 [Aaosphaeria arxii CBS 175.79]|uniref:RNase III domain-containing protein n=1 Tax=Aaosphaeria arxii CBS 175.79 TaxID=1450172 RepID=A0A6A5Y6G4_9PLEO|nr:uncharacterized protein BU24DRAFT_416819 [Aaosphaeria arxii CBS 175.79]KAF2021152.1 hypothetical protein BU24DRAFT_416819 [Aaosphaeria arxii CBS 175.79]
MASKSSIRNIITSSTSTIRCAQATQPIRRPFIETSACTFSTTSSRRTPEYDTESADRPRWQQTPARMTAPFRTRPLPKGPVFKVNEDPRRLDDAYSKMLGSGGDKVLSDEVKWLAVTHKSFDHGRRGFNDRLAFLGRRIVSLQTSLALLSSPQASKVPEADNFGRKPYTHVALDGLPGLTQEAKDSVLDKSRLAQIAQRYGLDKVTRWKPRKADNLQGSGQEAVLATSLYAIIGAIALERGGEVANKVTQEKILSPLGFTFQS